MAVGVAFGLMGAFLRISQMVLRYRSKSPARNSTIPRMMESFSPLSFMVRSARNLDRDLTCSLPTAAIHISFLAAPLL